MQGFPGNEGTRGALTEILERREAAVDFLIRQPEPPREGGMHVDVRHLGNQTAAPCPTIGVVIVDEIADSPTTNRGGPNTG